MLGSLNPPKSLDGTSYAIGIHIWSALIMKTEKNNMQLYHPRTATSLNECMLLPASYPRGDILKSVAIGLL